MTAMTTPATHKAATQWARARTLRAVSAGQEVREVAMSEERADRIIESLGEIKGQLSSLASGQDRQHESHVALEVRVRLLEQRPTPLTLLQIIGASAGVCSVIGTLLLVINYFTT